MKTPHRIKLVKQGASTYNPITDKHEEKAQSSKVVPCLVNFIDQQRAFEAYGSRSDVVMICRFSKEQKPFDYALYEGKKYYPIEQIDAPIKGAIRLKRGELNG